MKDQWRVLISGIPISLHRAASRTPALQRPSAANVRPLQRSGMLSCCAIGLIASAATVCHAQAPFDLDTGNAPFEVIIPTVIPAIISDVSPSAGDVTAISRITALTTTAWFDAIAPYHPTAVGVYTQFDQRQLDATNRNKNIAILHASLQVLSSLMPQRTTQWRQMLASVGLDPANTSTDPATPAGIGNLAGRAVVRAREHDGMNQLGDAGGCRYNCRPYADYLGYKPVNTAYKLLVPSRWQPAIVTSGNGLFQVQQFVMPQMRVTTPFSYDDPDQFRAPPPWPSLDWTRRAYRDQADEVLRISANLTDTQKMKAEMFDHKFNSLASAVVFTVMSRQMTLEQSVFVEFLTNMSFFDAAIAVWNEKARYDAVRPFSAIHYLYGDQPVTAWGGPGRGTVTDLPGNQWTSYLNVANHPEYPSASATFCAAHAQVLRHVLGSDALGFSVTVPAGSSRVEPGVTPATDLVLSWDTWTQFENECGQSRVWGGVHFSAAVVAGREMGHRIGDVAYQFAQRHLEGRVFGTRAAPQGRVSSAVPATPASAARAAPTPPAPATPR